MRERERNHDAYFPTTVRVNTEIDLDVPNRSVFLEVHESLERYGDGLRELVPLDPPHGTRRYLHARPFYLLPDVRMDIALTGNPAEDAVIGTVLSYEHRGFRRQAFGNAQAWHYQEPNVLMLWEVVLHERHRSRILPLTLDSLYTGIWQSWEQTLTQRCPTAPQIYTPFGDPAYDRDEYQAFLRDQGYSPSEHPGVFVKDIRRRNAR